MQIRGFFHSILILLLGLWISACQESPSDPEASPDPFAHITDMEARSVLQQAMEAMGGLERWQSKKEIRFSKDYTLLYENGEVEAHASQLHSYSYDPDPIIHIVWLKKGQAHVLQQVDGNISKTIDGQADTSANPQSLTNTVLSATFVANLPYNLLDPGAEISYADLDTLETGQSVHAIRIAYNPEAHANHSTPDIWHVYFDQSSYVMVAYMVQHADHYSYVRNLSDTIVEGFRLVKDRNSWRVDSVRNLLYLRATYAYGGYEVEW